MRKALAALAVALAFAVLVVPSVSANAVGVEEFSFYLSAPKVEGSQFSNLTTENFNTQTLGNCPASTTWASGAWTVDVTGTGTNCVYNAPGNYGGAVTAPNDPSTVSSGSGTNYMRLGADTLLTVNFGAQQRYVGFWYSAGDANSSMEFYSNGVLVGRFSTSILMSMLGTGFSNTLTTVSGTSVAASQYAGNPRNNSNTGEPYAFINIVPTNLTFDTITMHQAGGGSSFELDNLVASTTAPVIDSTQTPGFIGFPPYLFPSNTPITAVQCQSTSFALFDSNFAGPPTYSVAPTLPAGLTLDVATGVVSGTPTTPSSSTNYVFTAANNTQSASGTVALSVTASSTPCPSSTPSSNTLADTGATTQPLIWGAAAVLAVGVFATVAVRRRRYLS